MPFSTDQPRLPGAPEHDRRSPTNTRFSGETAAALSPSHPASRHRSSKLVLNACFLTHPRNLQEQTFAGCVILEQDPLDEKVPATRIRDIKVCETWKGANRVSLKATG